MVIQSVQPDPSNKPNPANLVQMLENILGQQGITPGNSPQLFALTQNLSDQVSGTHTHEYQQKYQHTHHTHGEPTSATPGEARAQNVKPNGFKKPTYTETINGKKELMTQRRLDEIMTTPSYKPLIKNGKQVKDAQGNPLFLDGEDGRKQEPDGSFKYAKTRKFFQDEGLVETPQGWMQHTLNGQPVRPDGTSVRSNPAKPGGTQGVGAAPTGMQTTQAAAKSDSGMKFEGVTKYATYGLGYMFGGGGLMGLGTAWLAGKLVKSLIAGGSGSGGSGGSGLISSTGALLGLGAGALAIGGLLKFEGAAFNVRMIMNSHARESRDNSFISMVQNRGIPIEDLIFLFLAHMNQRYEDKLREKMEESALAEKLQDRSERRKRKAEMAAGLAEGIAVSAGSALGLLGGIGGSLLGGTLGSAAGTAAGNAIRSANDRREQIERSFNGNMKSSTHLAAEVQVLVQKWKQLVDMMSNLSKTLHEMAMTPIRNLR